MSIYPNPLIPTNPATGAELAPVQRTPLEEIPSIVERSQVASRAWAQQSLDQRIEALEGFASSLRDPAVSEPLAAQITAEMGKTLREARGEVKNVGARLKAFGERTRLAIAETVGCERGIEVTTLWRPLGVVAVIAPWNYPVATPSNLLLSALLTGNGVVLKPSEQTPRTGSILHDLLAAALPRGLVGIVQGGAAEGAALVESDVQMIAMTGSIATGKAIMRSAAEGLKRLVLELGGKDSMIVLPGADLDAAARHAALQATANAGQACISVERIIVHASLADRFLDLVRAQVAEIIVGDPLDESTTIGPMASEAQRSLVLAQLADAKAKGARLIVEGVTRTPGFYLEPTVITDLNREMSLVREETFGPVVAVEVCGSAEEAIAWVNESHYGLGASIWGQPGAELEGLARRLQVGMIGINRGLSAAAGGPWVGWKNSGVGFSRSVAGMRQFMQPQSLARSAIPSKQD